MKNIKCFEIPVCIVKQKYIFCSLDNTVLLPISAPAIYVIIAPSYLSCLLATIQLHLDISMINKYYVALGMFAGSHPSQQTKPQVRRLFTVMYVLLLYYRLTWLLLKVLVNRYQRAAGLQ